MSTPDLKHLFVPGEAMCLRIWLARKLDETKETEITTETVKAVEEKVITKRNTMYQIHFNELDRMSLLPVTESIAEVFLQSGSPILHESTLEEAIERGLAGDEPITNERVMKKSSNFPTLAISGK